MPPDRAQPTGGDGSAAEAYDLIAHRYDELAGSNPVLAHLREVNLRTLDHAFLGHHRLLELGSGTGEEAVHLLKKDPQRTVVGTDPAPAMVDRARERARKAGVGARATFHDLAAHEIGSLLKGYGEDAFDGAWSSFALHYEPDLQPIARDLASLLRSGAPLVMTLRNPWVLLAPWTVPERLAGRYLHRVGLQEVPIYHRSLGETRAILGGAGFRLREARALPLVMPPPNLGGALDPVRPVAKLLARADDLLGGLPGLRRLGDHTLLVLEKR